MTYITFRIGESVKVNLPLEEVRKRLQKGLAKHTFVEFESGSRTIVINPQQVQFLETD